MCKLFRSILTLLLITLCSCYTVAPEIETSCELDQLGNYNIKWSIYPHVEGMVEIYASLNPNHFDLSAPPIATVPIRHHNIYISSTKQRQRTYFLLRFNGKHEAIVATRVQDSLGINNFRDMGGYASEDGRHLRWGMLYRSSTIRHLDPYHAHLFRSLHIHSVYDLRSDVQSPPLYPELHINNIHSLIIPFIGKSEIIRRLRQNELKRGDAILFMQDVNLSLVYNAPSQLRLVFEGMLNEKSYPLVVSCLYGKDYTGFFMSMILSALDVPRHVILNDYLLSNDYIDTQRFSRLKYEPTHMQEVYTALLSARRSFLNIALDRICQEYGSVNNYLEMEVGLTPEKRNKLKSILLQ